MKKLSRFPLFLLFAGASVVSCKKSELETAGNNNIVNGEIRQGGIVAPGFNMDKFEQNIMNTYAPNTIGFSYAISSGDNVVRYGGEGKSRISTEGNIIYTASTRQELASVTKFMTAIAAFKLLEIKGKTPNELIKNYLPDSWATHSDYNNLSFKQMLAHKSGFPIEERDYANLKTMVNSPKISTAYNYNNANFALCRILLPYLLKGKAFFAPYEGNDGQLEAITANEFRKIMRSYVLQPSGLTYWDKADFADWHHISLASYPCPRYYNFESPYSGSTSNGDDFLIAGSRGLVLSTYEVAQVITAFEKGLLVSAGNMNTMKTEGCGFDGAGVTGDHGTYYWKNGAGGGESMIMVFPNNVRVSINANSRKNSGSVVASASLIATAYDNAW
jgi:hypothetical protein